MYFFLSCKTHESEIKTILTVNLARVRLKTKVKIKVGQDRWRELKKKRNYNNSNKNKLYGQRHLVTIRPAHPRQHTVATQ